MAKVKKTLALEIIGFKHPQTNETALVRTNIPHLFTIQVDIKNCNSLKLASSKNIRPALL